MTRQHYPFTNPATGLTECLYAGCGREIPSDHYLCKRHYFQLGEGLVEPCPGLNCSRFKSVNYDFCADCSKRLATEDEPQWEAADEACNEFYAYLLVNPDGDWYAGQTRNLRNRMWMHRMGRCHSTQDGDYRLVWFEVHPTREAATGRELELKRLVATDPYAVLDRIFRFQDNVAQMQYLGDVVQTG